MLDEHLSRSHAKPLLASFSHFASPPLVVLVLVVLGPPDVVLPFLEVLLSWHLHRGYHWRCFITCKLWNQEGQQLVDHHNTCIDDAIPAEQ